MSPQNVVKFKEAENLNHTGNEEIQLLTLLCQHF